MIKEYFTDGLIGLAILISLFRTDIFDLNINNLINYPEVQDIIQGQTAVSMPADFHSNSIHILSQHPKLGDRNAFSVWYRNLINSPHFRQNTLNDIEAFLVSGSQLSTIDSFVNNEASVNISELHSNTTNDNVPQNTSQTLPQESANSFREPELVDVVIDEDDSAIASSSTDTPLSVDVTFLFNNPFPGCNLTTEDLNLIELLWKQDVDLGVGKEVYDASLREELERQREVEQYKQQEKLKAQVAAREKEEKSKQEEASRWLKQNFMRDGETGEWVKLQNKTSKSNGSASLATVNEKVEDSLTLEAALDYMSSSMDSNCFTTATEEVPLVDSLSGDLNSYQTSPGTDIQTMQPLHGEESITQLSVPGLYPSNDLENEWTEVEEYLNISLTSPQFTTATEMGMMAQQESPKLVGGDGVASLDTHLPQIIDQGMFTSTDLPLLQDVALPSVDLEPVPELGEINLTNNSLPPQQCNMNTSLDWELGNITLFNDLAALPEGHVGDLDLQSIDDLFNRMNETTELPNLTSSDMNYLMASGPVNDSSTFLNTASFSESQDLSDVLDGLEGATGGADYSSLDNYDTTPYKKMSRLSESSSDSGFSSKGGFGSSSSSSTSSYGAGSPADLTPANSTNSNDTDNDPDGTLALAHQVAHNHTYNTLPGHVPREVKKYAPKESTKKGPHCRDQKRAQELKIPFSIDQIVDSPVETFNDILAKYSLTDEQLNLVRDIRRRGKNKLAAQNCRKRKVGVIVTLSDEMSDLEKVRDRLKAERAEMERETHRMKEKFSHLYSHIFQSLRDEHGQPYDSNLYSLQQSSDGNVFLVPRNVTSNGVNGTSTNSSSSMSNEINRVKKRRSDN